MPARAYQEGNYWNSLILRKKAGYQLKPWDSRSSAPGYNIIFFSFRFSGVKTLVLVLTIMSTSLAFGNLLMIPISGEKIGFGFSLLIAFSMMPKTNFQIGLGLITYRKYVCFKNIIWEFDWTLPSIDPWLNFLLGKLLTYRS